MVYVFDSSFVAALVIPDEKNQQVDKMYTKIKDEDERHIPHLFWYEISNVFKSLVLRKRYTPDDVSRFFPLLAAFRLKEDFETGIGYSKDLLHLCASYNISSYDAAYLELAKRKKAVLCTLDENLQAAAKKHGVAVI